MTALSCHSSVPECQTDSNIPDKPSLPAENTHSSSPQSCCSLPNGTQGKCLEWRDNAEHHLTIPGLRTFNLTTGLAYIPIWFDPDLAFWPV